MYDHALYLKTLSQFTAALLTPYDVDSVLREVATRISDVLGLAGSGVTLARGGRLEPAVAAPPHLVGLEDLECSRQTGPCLDAFHTGQVVAVESLDKERDRWPEYCQLAERLGVSAVAGIPMRLQGQAVGALNLYGDGPRTWPHDDLAPAVVMADMATAYLINASKMHQQIQLNEQLQFALESRIVIEQAKGAIAGAHGITVDEAFQRIRRHARSHNTSIRSVAEAIVNVGLRV